MNDPKPSHGKVGPAPSAAERNALKRRGHALKAHLTMGRAGLSDAFVHEVDEALRLQGLIKVRIAAEDAAATRQYAAELAAKAEGHMVQVVGRVALLYRPGSKKDRKGAKS